MAILSRAIQDLFGSIGSTVSPEGEIVVRRSALNFWTAATGDAAKDRDLLCSLVGFDGGAMRARVIAILEGDDRQVAGYGGYAHLNYVESARALWAQSKQKPLVAKAQAKPRPLVPKPPPKLTPKPKPAPAMLTPEEEEAKRRELRAVIMQLLEQGPLTKRQLFAAVGAAGKSSAVAAHLYHAQRQGHVESNGDFWSLKPDRAARPQLLVAAQSG